LTPSDLYRTRAARLERLAMTEGDPAVRLEFQKLAKAYRRLADQADRNRLTDVSYEPPLRDVVGSD
jgi:hypothetical protein